MVGLVIQNENKDKPIGFSFRRKDQLFVEVIWNLFEKAAQYNAKLNAFETLIVNVYSVKVPVRFGGIRTKDRQLDNMAHLKRNIVRVNAEENCLTYALVIAIAKVQNDPNYKVHRQGRKTRPEVQRLLETTGIDPSMNVFRTNFATSTRFLFMEV
jgi:ribosome-associated translation inhibitor RaiA